MALVSIHGDHNRETPILEIPIHNAHDRTKFLSVVYKFRYSRTDGCPEKLRTEKKDSLSESRESEGREHCKR